MCPASALGDPRRPQTYTFPELTHRQPDCIYELGRRAFLDPSFKPARFVDIQYHQAETPDETTTTALGAEALLHVAALQGSTRAQRVTSLLFSPGSPRLRDYTQAHETIAITAAMAGNAEVGTARWATMYVVLGWLCETGRGCQHADVAEARELYSIAARGGSVDAALELFRLWRADADSAPLSARHVRTIRAAAERGDALAQFAAAVLLREGWPDGQKDEAQGVTFLRQAATAGHTEAADVLASIPQDEVGRDGHISGTAPVRCVSDRACVPRDSLGGGVRGEEDDKENGYNMLRDTSVSIDKKDRALSSTTQNVPAREKIPTADLDMTLRDGVDLTPDEEESDIPGQDEFKTALAYYRGDGTEKQSLRQAAHLFRESAMLGNTHAMWRLGRCYELGHGVEESMTYAQDWYARAAAAGNCFGMFYLGKFCKWGFGGRQQPQRASDLFHAAVPRLKALAAHGDGYALYVLGICFDCGLGVSPQRAYTLECFRRADRAGCVEGTYWVGMFLCGDCFGGTCLDKREVLSYFEKAAQAGHCEALNKLASCYSSGQGVEKNVKKAAKLKKQYLNVMRS